MAQYLSDFEDEIKEQIIQNDFLGAFKILESICKNTHLYNEICQLHGRYNQLMKNKILGIQEQESFTTSQDNIRYSLLLFREKLIDFATKDTLVQEKIYKHQQRQKALTSIKAIPAEPILSEEDEEEEEVNEDPQLQKMESPRTKEKSQNIISTPEEELVESYKTHDSSNPNSDLSMEEFQNDLYTRQTESTYIKLLAAQKQLYIDGKRINSAIFLMSICIAIVFPVLLKYFPEYQNMIGLLGGFLAIALAWGLRAVPAKKAESAARVQEEFDTELFGLEWNKKCGDKISKHVIESASRRLKDRSNIDGRPWYEDYRKLEHSKAVLQCMQENLYWDSTQKKAYNRFLILLAVSLLTLGWIWGFEILQLPHTQYLLQVFLPFSGFLIYLIQTIQRNQETSIKQTEKGNFARGLSENYLGSPLPVPEDELRNLQDAIFEMRKNGVLVPEWFYKLNKKRLELTLKGVSDDLNQ